MRGSVWACHEVASQCPGGTPCPRDNMWAVCGLSGYACVASGWCAFLVFFGLCVEYRVIASLNRATQNASIEFMTICDNRGIGQLAQLGDELGDCSLRDPFVCGVDVLREVVCLRARACGLG